MYTKKAPPAETELLQTGLAVLAQHGLGARLAARGVAPDTGEHALVRLQFGPRTVPHHLRIERWLTPATVGHAVDRLRKLRQPALLLTDYATPPVAEKLRALGVNFVDAAGNAYLAHGPTLIWVVGRKAHIVPRPRTTRAFQPGGLKLLFALLCTPDLIARPTRTIAAHAGVANGTVGAILRELREDGYLVELRQARGKRILRNRKRLLEQWTQGFARTLRPRVVVGRYRTPEPDWWRHMNPGEDGGVFGGEAAAAILTGTLRPGVVTVYLPEPQGRFILANRLVTAADGTVEIREKFWPFEYPWEHRHLAPPLLIYADLLATGDARCLEAAQRVYEEYLARLIRED